MPNQNFYRALKDYGEKLYPFSQRKSRDHISEANFGDDYRAVKGGLCAAVTVDWLHEKLSKPRGADKRNFEYTRTILDRLVSRLPDKAAARERNANTMFAAGWDQVYYSNQTRQSLSSAHMEELFRLRGLQHSQREAPGSSPLIALTHPTNPDQSCEYDVVNSLERAVRALSTGRGVMFSVGVGSDGGHSIALYRSHRNNLYFFDANSGVYKVNQPREFIAAWKTACETRGGGKLDLSSRRQAHGIYYLDLGSQPQQRAPRPLLAPGRPQTPMPPPPAQTRADTPRRESPIAFESGSSSSVSLSRRRSR